MANGPEFFQTIMGRTFYEGTMPRLVKQLEKLNENIEKLVEAQKSIVPTAQPGDKIKVIVEKAAVLGEKLDPKELANTSQSMQSVMFSLTQEAEEEEEERDIDFGTAASAAFRRAQSTLEEMRLKMESDNAKKWVVLCKRTEDPKLGWLERTLDGHGIPNRRNGFSYHGPILEVREDFEGRAQRILSLVDHMDDDNAIFMGER
jgi:hypothetical protein